MTHTNTLHAIVVPLLCTGFVAAATAAQTPPNSITVTGVVRDFKERTVQGGHPDFEKRPAEGFGHYCKNVEEDLAGDAPEYNSCGFKVKRQWKDSAGRNICWLLYDDDRGDIEGAADAFLMWTKAAGRVLPGLVKRRNDERALFLSSQF